MANYGTKRTNNNINTLPLWARIEYLESGSITGKNGGNINVLPAWARNLGKK